jgi:hypothetical protein
VDDVDRVLEIAGDREKTSCESGAVPELGVTHERPPGRVQRAGAKRKSRAVDDGRLVEKTAAFFRSLFPVFAPPVESPRHRRHSRVVAPASGQDTMARNADTDMPDCQ